MQPDQLLAGVDDVTLGREIAQVAAVEPSVTDAELGMATKTFMQALVHFIISIVTVPMRRLIRTAVLTEVQRQLSFREAALRAEIQRELDSRQSDLLLLIDQRIAASSREVRFVYATRRYPWALALGIIGGVVGFIGSAVLTFYFGHAVVVDGAGQDWFATTIADSKVFDMLFIAVGTAFVAFIGTLAGWIVDNRTNKRELEGPVTR